MAAEMTQDESAILALASGLSQRQAARQSGMSPRTIARRMQDPAFRRLVADRQAALLNEAAGRITALMRHATSTLKKLLSSKSDIVRLGSARAILDAAIKIKGIVEFDRRLADLEASQHAKQ